MMNTKIDRRTFLRASGVAVGLPVLECTSSHEVQASETNQERRRMLAICAPLGIHTPFLIPKTAGKKYEVTPYLEPLQPVREKFSVLSGLMHPMVDGGHAAEKSFLTGAAHPGQPSFRNTISVDQFAAERIGHQTRLPFLSLSAGHGGISYTRSGVLIPSESRPSRVFQQLFMEGDAAEKEKRVRRIKTRAKHLGPRRRTGSRDPENVKPWRPTNAGPVFYQRSRIGKKNGEC